MNNVQLAAIRERVREQYTTITDPAHDFAHFERVVRTAERLALSEGARLEVVLPAAWLHDLEFVAKNDPRRSQASRLSAQAATEFLTQIGYEDAATREEIAHAIETHSYSAGLPPRTLEAQIVQDADRLDGVGAIGIARCFTVGGMLGRSLYSTQEPFARTRALDDSTFTLDHFYIKLFKTIETLHTRAAREEGLRRAQSMRDFLQSLERELG